MDNLSFSTEHISFFISAIFIVTVFVIKLFSDGLGVNLLLTLFDLFIDTNPVFGDEQY